MQDNTALINYLISYYQNVLLLQYKSKPKALATIQLLVQTLLQDGIVLDVQDAFDLNTAVGKQLDILGKYIGVTRYFNGQTFPDGYFGFCLSSSPTSTGQKGFCLSSTFTTDKGQYLLSSEVLGNSQQLSDDNYRILLKFRVVCNSIDLTWANVNNALFEFFGLNVLLTSKNNMTITYFIDPSLGVLATVLLEKNVLPHPIGVGISGIIIKKTAPFFGFCLSSNPNIISTLKTGFCLSSNFLTKSGNFLLSSEVIT